MKKRLLAIVCTLFLLLPLLSVTPAYAASVIEVGYSSPAICINVGETVDLTSVSVQFEYGAPLISASKISWKEGDTTLTSYTPAAKGVYPLSATSGEKTKEIFIVAKNTDESEYVLYENDFSAEPDMAQFRVIQQPAGTTFGYDAAEGAIYLDASNDGASHMRVMLPEFLDNFGDAIYTSEMKITKPTSSSRYASMIFRLQNVDGAKFPYHQVVTRYTSTASNGVEISHRTEADKWDVTQKSPCLGVNGGDYFTMSANFCGTVSTNTVNGTKYLTENNTHYNDGAMGFQVRGAYLTVSSVKITVNPESRPVVITTLNDTRDVKSNIALSPVLVTEVKTASELTSLDTTLPAIAIFDAELSSDALGVTIDGKYTPISELALSSRIIPALRVDSQSEAEAVGSYAASLPLSDMYVISSDSKFISAARAKCSSLYAMVEISSFDGNSEALRANTVACGGRGVIFAESVTASKQLTSYLQDRYLTVWQKTNGSALSVVTAVNNGVLGIVTPDVAKAEACYTEYYTQNTLARTPEIIGHRGIPSTAQENSLAGALAAIKAGATMVECDVYLMKDGNIVVMHDSSLERTTNGTGSITQQTAATIKNYQIDLNTAVPTEPIPLLQDLLTAFAHSGETLVIELKSSDAKLAEPLVKLIKDCKMGKQVVIISFSQDMIAAIRKADPSISVNYLADKITADENNSLEVAKTILKAVIPQNTAYSPSYAAGKLGTNLFTDLAARGVTVWNWTVNTRTEFNKFFVSGIRGITTNYANWASDYIEDFSVSIAPDGTVTPVATTYAGDSADITAAELITIGGSGEYKEGKVTLSEDAEGFFFRLTGKLSNNTEYSVVTPVVLKSDLTLIPGGDAEETTPLTPDDDKGGCGSSIALSSLVLLSLGAAVILKKKKH